ncbi:MAG: metallophosphoesterase [Bacteroidota bacterium]|nr:metallophosphoesterase [Bacteroidota bacterium]
MHCFFASDLHGHQHRYETLFARIASDAPDAVFLGGDLLPAHARSAGRHYPPVADFFSDFLLPKLRVLRSDMKDRYPRLFLILGNDDPRTQEVRFRDPARAELWTYVHDSRAAWGRYTVYGYACVPPTPFQLKDWERYDVSRYVDPGCVSPEEGRRTVPVDTHALRYGSIKEDLEELTGDDNLARALMLFHSPPYQTVLDRAALDGKSVDHVPLDVHVGSVAIRRFIERRQPRISMHGHIHESATITGSWKERIGETWCYSAAHRGGELALVRFDPEFPADAVRELL